MAKRRLTELEAALRGAAEWLDSKHYRWALVGGLAVSARAEPRTTRDVDLAVHVSGDTEAETLVFSLQAAGFRVLAAIEHDRAGRLATVRLQPPGRRMRGAVVDLLFASSGVEKEVVSMAERLEILPGFSVPVAQTGHLIALKILSRDDVRRARDAEDLRALLAEAGPVDLALSRDTLSLITERGFNREKDLGMELERARQELGPGNRDRREGPGRG